jgi:hypothetical protein
MFVCFFFLSCKLSIEHKYVNFSPQKLVLTVLASRFQANNKKKLLQKEFKNFKFASSIEIYLFAVKYKKTTKTTKLSAIRSSSFHPLEEFFFCLFAKVS